MEQTPERVGPRRADLVETEIDDDVSIFDPGTQEVYLLNRTASDVWRLCDGHHPVEEIAALLAAAYGTSAEAITDEVIDAVGTFTEKGLLSAE